MSVCPFLKDYISLAMTLHTAQRSLAYLFPANREELIILEVGPVLVPSLINEQPFQALQYPEGGRPQ